MNGIFMLGILFASALLFIIRNHMRFEKEFKEFNSYQFTAVKPSESELQKPQPGWSIVPVVGESFENYDGRSRQDIIRNLRPGDAIRFLPEPDNKYDSRALAVISAHGQIGYVGRDDDSRDHIAARIADGIPFEARVLNILGGTEDRQNYGVTVEVSFDIR